MQSVRTSATDIPSLVCAAAKSSNGLRIVLGARPARAVIAADALQSWDMAQMERMAQQVTFGTNQRAGEAYRRKIAPVLMARAAAACEEE